MKFKDYIWAILIAILCVVTFIFAIWFLFELPYRIWPPNPLAADNFGKYICWCFSWVIFVIVLTIQIQSRKQNHEKIYP